MTVNPGFGGQKFIETTLPKIARLRQMLDARGLRCDLEADGGIGPATAAAVVKAGANVLVAGAAVYGPSKAWPPRSRQSGQPRKPREVEFIHAAAGG